MVNNNMKTRQSIGDMCNISCSERYIPKLNQWVVNKNVESSTFISTELTADEVQLAFLSTVSGVAEEKIKFGKTNAEEENRIMKAVQILKQAPIYCEYNSNYSISEIENIIEKNIIRYDVKYVFFDYIQITQNLATELIKAFGYALREDSMLSQLSSALKNLANKYDVFIGTSTQLNRNYKTDSYPDATWLRGGMAVLDKADYGVITMKVKGSDIEKLKPILESRFGDNPTHVHHIIKNRGGKWVGISVWVTMDLDTINVYDENNGGFATTFDFEYIKGLVPINLV